VRSVGDLSEDLDRRDNGHHMSADRLDWGESYKTSGVVQIKSFYLQSSSVYPSINMTVTPINSHSDFQNIVRGAINPRFVSDTHALAL
jgi:hypothetical protein